MSASHRLIERLDAHRDVAFDLVRIYLGIGLFIRGWLFIADSSTLVGLLSDAGSSSFTSAGVAHYVALAHLGGGLLMALGLLTRLAALIQIPILIGAVFLIHLNDGLLAVGQSFEFSALVLFLLVLVFWHGSGRLSLDYYLFEREEANAIRDAQLGLFDAARENAREPVAAEPVAATTPLRARDERPPVPPGSSGCTCTPPRDRYDPRVEPERRYGMRALRFVTGTTGTPKEIVFRCRVCGNVVETSQRAEDIARYTYR